MATDADEKVLDDEEMDETDEFDEVAEGSIAESRARRKRRRGESVAQDATPTTEKKGRATPSRRKGETKSAATSGSSVDNTPVIGGIVRYFKGVYAEMQKVTWPTREETINLTQVVLAVTIAFAIGLGLLDTFYTWWFDKAIQNETTTFLIIAGIVAVVAGGIVYAVFYRDSDTVPY